MMNNSGSESRNSSNNTSLSHKPSSAAHSLRNHSSSTPNTSNSPKSLTGATARKENGGRSSAGAVNGHDSEADTDILSDEERPRPRKRQGPNDKRASPAVVAKSELTSHPASRRSSMDNGGGREARRVNGIGRRDGEKRPTNKVKSVEKATSSSSRAQSAEASLSAASEGPSETAYDSPDRTRHSLSVEPRKRKLSDEQSKSKIEPPRQRPRLDSSASKSKRLSSPSSNPPASAGHKRSISNQSGIARITSRKKREVSTTSAQSDRGKWDDDDSSDDSGSPRPRKDRSIPHLGPSKNRVLSSSQRALTSPARTNPIHSRRADKYGTTPLAKACEKGHLDQVKKAYEQAPEELDQGDNGGFTPLQKASLGGHFEVVKFLLDKGCRRDCASKEEHDTPLIDAVENGHYKVVKLLLDSGVNPHHANKNGNRAIDAVNFDKDHADDIETALKKAMDEWQGGEEDHDDVPHESVTIQQRRDGGLRPDLLYQALTPENLLKYSTSGDLEAIGMLLESVEPTIACAVAAARSGHTVALELLLASAQTMERDPSPVKHDETPMLAAIGRGHLKVIELLLNQDNFNPCRKTRDGKTYWELAAERRGPRWQQEVELLKARYDEHKENAGKKREGKGSSSKSGNKEHLSPKSPRLSKTSLKQQQSRPVEKPQPAIVPAVEDQQREKKKRLSGGSTKESSKDGTRKRRVVEEDDSSDGSSDDHANQQLASSKRRAQGSISRQPIPRKVSTSTGSSQKHKDKDKDKEKEKEKEESNPPSSPRVRSKPGRKPQVKREEVDPDNDITMEDVPPAKSSDETLKEKERNSKRAAREEAAERKAREEAEAQLKAEAEAREQEEKEARLKKEKEDEERKKKEREEYLAKLPIMLRRALEKGMDRPMLSYRPEVTPSPAQTPSLNGGMAQHFVERPRRIIGVKEAFLPLYTVKHQDIDHSLIDQAKFQDRYILSHQVIGILGLSELDIASTFPNWQTLPVTKEHLEKYILGWDVGKLMMESLWPQMGQRGFDSDATNAAIETCKSQFIELYPTLRWVRIEDFAREFEKRRSVPTGKDAEKLKELSKAGELQKMDLLNLRRPRPAGYRPWDDPEHNTSQQSNGIKKTTGGIASKEVVKKKPEGLRSGLGSVYMPGAKYKDLISPRSASVVTSTKGSPVGSVVASPLIPQGMIIGNARSPSVGSALGSSVNGVNGKNVGRGASIEGGLGVNNGISEDTVMDG